MASSKNRTLGSVLRSKREELGLSLRAVAQAAELAPSSVSRLENDEIGATDDTVRRLAKALRTSYRDLSVLADGNLPNFAPYLRAKYDLSPEAISQLEGHFAAVTKQQAAKRRSQS